MNVLVACEESQRVCIAFRERGHNAFSCDIEPCSGGHPDWHIMQDVISLLNGKCGFKTVDGSAHSIDGKWDLIIAHPPCTYLSNAGARFLYPKGILNEERLKKGLKAKDFFMEIYNADNGMKKMSKVFKGTSVYGQIDLQNIYRSEIANIAEQMKY